MEETQRNDRKFGKGLSTSSCVTDEETEAVITDGLAKVTEKEAKPGLQLVSNSGPHFVISCYLFHFGLLY